MEKKEYTPTKQSKIFTINNYNHTNNRDQNRSTGELTIIREF